MNRRLELHEILCDILGSRNVYFQPPESIKLLYPCIVYSCSDIDVRFANNKPYSNEKAYTITVIDKNPDGPFPDLISLLPMCRFDRHFTSDNLNHYVFTIYY